MTATQMLCMFDKFSDRELQQIIAQQMLDAYVPYWIRENYDNSNIMGLYTIDGFKVNEIRQMLKCISSEIEAHKRRKVPTKDQLAIANLV